MQGDLVGFGDAAGLDGSQSFTQAFAGLPQELQRVGGGVLRSSACESLIGACGCRSGLVFWLVRSPTCDYGTSRRSMVGPVLRPQRRGPSRCACSAGTGQPPTRSGPPASSRLGGVAWPGTAARAKSRSPLIAGILACLPLDRAILGFPPARAGAWGRHLAVAPARRQARGRVYIVMTVFPSVWRPSTAGTSSRPTRVIGGGTMDAAATLDASWSSNGTVMESWKFTPVTPARASVS